MGRFVLGYRSIRCDRMRFGGGTCFVGKVSGLGGSSSESWRAAPLFHFSCWSSMVIVGGFEFVLGAV